MSTLVICHIGSVRMYAVNKPFIGQVCFVRQILHPKTTDQTNLTSKNLCIIYNTVGGLCRPFWRHHMFFGLKNGVTKRAALLIYIRSLAQSTDTHFRIHTYRLQLHRQPTSEYKQVQPRRDYKYSHLRPENKYQQSRSKNVLPRLSSKTW